jgi:hypothetical protein
MQPSGSATDQLFARLEQLKERWPKKGWSWDNRVNCVASSFHVDLTQESHQALVAALPEVYDYKTLAKANQQVRQVAERVGGVRSDQLIYNQSTQGRLVPYALWWPWGDEINISVRVGVAGYVVDSDFHRLQTHFNALA